MPGCQGIKDSRILIMGSEKKTIIKTFLEKIIRKQIIKLYPIRKCFITKKYAKDFYN